MSTKIKAIDLGIRKISSIVVEETAMYPNIDIDVLIKEAREDMYDLACLISSQSKPVNFTEFDNL